MGYLVLLLLGLMVAGLLWRLNVALPLWTIVGAALMLGATGYTLQGEPLLPGRPTLANARPFEVDAGLVDLRGDLFGRYTADAAYLTAGDAMLRGGNSGAAVQVMLGGIRNYPGSVELWTGLGTALAIHDGNQMSPSALLAFQHAIRLSPNHPGPPFFAGLTYVRAGSLAEAEPYWRRALSLTPVTLPYRDMMSIRLALLKAYLKRGGTSH